MSPIGRLSRILCVSCFNHKRVLNSGISKYQLVKRKNIFLLNFLFPNSFILNTVKRNFSIMEGGENIPSKEELLKKLTPLQYHVTQEKGTERPYTGEFDKSFDEGTYSCIVCGQYLFSSNTKYDSGCGWPAFNDVLEKGRIKFLPDTSGGRIRTEVQCSRCSAHLGHVFDDGPKPTGKRYCINSASINFLPAKNKE